MGTPGSSDGRGPVPTEHERFKLRARRRLWAGFGAALGLHLIFIFWDPGFRAPTLAFDAARDETRALRVIPVEVLERRPVEPSPLVPPAEERSARPVGEAVPSRPLPASEPIPLPPPPPTLPVDLGEEVAEWAAAAEAIASAAPRVSPPPLPEPEPYPSDTMDVLREYRRVNALMQKPELLNRSRIRRELLKEYPRELQRQKVEGSVVVWFWIDAKGKVQHYEIRVSSGWPELDLAAEKVIPKMRFRAAREKGKPIPVIVALPITFEVEELNRW